MDDHDNNIFDDDDALDYIMSEEVEHDCPRRSNNNSGCLSMILLLALPPLLGIGLYIV